MTPSELLNDYARNKKFGSIEFVYKGGNIVFIKKVETLITSAPYEKNSMAASRGDNGFNNGQRTENY